MKAPRTLNVALYLSRNPQALYVHCSASWAAIKADTAHFATPYPPAGVVEPHLAALASALTANEGGSPAETAALEGAAKLVRQDFHMLGKYVEGTLRASPLEDAPAVLANILMYVSKVGQRSPKAELALTHGATAGTALATALAVDQATAYFWEVSADQQSFAVGATTSQAHATLSGLTPGKLYYFRLRALKRDGTMTSYSQVVSFMVT
jgi:hypothetical protein